MITSFFKPKGEAAASNASSEGVQSVGPVKRSAESAFGPKADPSEATLGAAKGARQAGTDFHACNALPLRRDTVPCPRRPPP